MKAIDKNWGGGVVPTKTFDLDADNRVVVFKESGWIANPRHRHSFDDCSLALHCTASTHIPVHANVILHANSVGGYLTDFHVEGERGERIITASLHVGTPWLLYELNKVIGRGARKLFIAPEGVVKTKFNWRSPFHPIARFDTVRRFHISWRDSECDWHMKLTGEYHERAIALTRILNKK